MNPPPPDDAASHLSWYSQWFGEEYLELYPHRDEEEARNGVQLVLAHAALGPDSHALDLACGAGRHLREFHANGVRAIGLDLSPTLLRHARSRGLPLVRGDMRCIPIATDSLDLVVSFFTSFGYFADPEDDLQVLREVNRVLRTGGVFAFDFLNADHVRAGLPNRDARVVGNRSVRQFRALVDNGRAVEKRIEILGPSDTMPHIFYERVRLYSAAELTRMLADTGLTVLHRFGSYTGCAHTPESPRVILIGRAQ